MTIQQLHELFDVCPMKVSVEQGGRQVYSNGDCLGGSELARWPIELDGQAATAVSYTSGELEGLYHEAPVALAFVDEEMRYRHVNRRMGAMNGVAPEAHLGRTIGEVLPDLAPLLEPMLRRVVETGEPVVDLEISGPDWEHGVKERHCLLNFRPYQEGETRGVQGAVVEITSLKETEERLMGQTKIFEQVHDSVVQTDLEGRILAWNSGAERMFGYRFDEIAGQHVSRLYFEEDQDDIARRVMEPLLRDGQHEVVLRNRRKDGSECWIRLSLSLLRDRKGVAYGMVGYSDDMTARRAAEQALRASESRYRQLFEASPVGIAVWRTDGSLLEANDVFLTMTGGAAHWGKIAEMRDCGNPLSFEDEWVRADGSRCPILVGLARDPGNAEIVSYVIDRSSQKAAELAARESGKYLELALEGADLGVWDWNIETGHIRFNGRWAEMLGYAPDELEPQYSTWQRLIHPDDLSPTLRALADHLEGRTEAYQWEHRLRCKSGEWRWILDRGKVIDRGADGRPLRAAGTHLDITSRKQAEVALTESEKRFHAIFDQTFQFIGLLSPEGNLLEANQTALDFGGVTRDEVVNVPVWETFWWTIATETQERAKRAVERSASGEFVRYEVDVWGAGKRAVTIDFSLRPLFDQDGRVHLIIAEGRDISDLKRAQQLLSAESEKRRLEAVLRSMTKGVVIADPQGNVVSMNPAALTLLGIPSEAEALKPTLQFHEFELRSLEGSVVPLSEWPMSRVLRGETFTGYELEVRRTVLS